MPKSYLLQWWLCKIGRHLGSWKHISIVLSHWFSAIGHTPLTSYMAMHVKPRLSLISRTVAYSGRIQTHPLGSAPKRFRWTLTSWKQGGCHWCLSPGLQRLQNPPPTCCSHQTSGLSNGTNSSPLCPELWWQTDLLYHPQWRCCQLPPLQFWNSSHPVFGLTSTVKEKNEKWKSMNACNVNFLITGLTKEHLIIIRVYFSFFLPHKFPQINGEFQQTY